MSATEIRAANPGLAMRFCRRERPSFLSACGRGFGRLLAGSTASTMNQTSRRAGPKVVDWHRRPGDSAVLIAAVVHNVVVSVVVTRRTALFYRGNWRRGRKWPAESLPLRHIVKLYPAGAARLDALPVRKNPMNGFGHGDEDRAAT